MTTTVQSYGRLRNMWRSRAAFGLSVGLVIGALIVALVAGVASLFGGDNGKAPIQVVPAPATVTATDNDLSIPTSTPPVRWENVGGIQVPDGGGRFGPVQRDDSQQLATGYAHTPRGSLVALLNISARAAVGNWKPTAETQLTGPGKGLYISLRGRVDDSPPLLGYCQTAGFHFLSWTPDAATIDIASACPSGNIQAVTSTVEWHNGDWQEVILADASEGPHAIPLSSLTGYVPFYSEG